MGAKSDAPAWQFGDLSMNEATTIGDQVELVSIPAWITDDLPLSEQRDIVGCVGQTMTITNIDNLGYIWISKSEVQVEGKGATLTGPSFCVPSDCLKRLTSWTVIATAALRPFPDIRFDSFVFKLRHSPGQKDVDKRKYTRSRAIHWVI